ncbi:ribosome maturation factor RimM [Nitratifractor sp.]
MANERFFIAQVGRTVGLRGDLKLHLHTDFPQQFRKGVTLSSNCGDLTIADYNPARGTIRFEGYESVEAAKPLTNAKLYSDEEKTRELCPLEEGEHYWFDIIGSEVVEEGRRLGEVREIQRMLDTDYLLVSTDSSLVEQGLTESFLIPYIDRYLQAVDPEAKRIETQDAYAILESS